MIVYKKEVLTSIEEMVDVVVMIENMALQDINNYFKQETAKIEQNKEIIKKNAIKNFCVYIEPKKKIILKKPLNYGTLIQTNWYLDSNQTDYLM